MSRHTWTILTTAALLGCCISVHAQANGSTTLSGERLANNVSILSLDGGSLSRGYFGSALSTIGATVATGDGAVGIYNQDKSKTFSKLMLPLTSVTFDNQSGNILNERFAGSLQITTSNDQIATGGGSLKLSNFTLSLADQRLYADLDGANGYGARQQVALLKLTGMSGTTNVSGLMNFWFGPSPQCLPNELCYIPPNYNPLDASRLGLTFGQALLTDEGREAFKTSLNVLDMGSEVFDVYYDRDFTSVEVKAIPEPSTVALMALGLAGVAVAARRRSAAVAKA